MTRRSLFSALVQGLAWSASATLSVAWGGNGESAAALDEVVVTATLRATPALEVPASVTVLDTATLQDAGQQHFEDVLALVPNMNWAGDTSRPRYFQLRGIGELEQYQGYDYIVVNDDLDRAGRDVHDDARRFQREACGEHRRRRAGG